MQINYFIEKDNALYTPANNAATGAAMIPLLALGLPGGAMTALMVGVFQMNDLEPGPMVFYN